MIRALLFFTIASLFLISDSCKKAGSNIRNPDLKLNLTRLDSEMMGFDRVKAFNLNIVNNSNKEYVFYGDTLADTIVYWPSGVNYFKCSEIKDSLISESIIDNFGLIVKHKILPNSTDNLLVLIDEEKIDYCYALILLDCTTGDSSTYFITKLLPNDM